LCSSLRQLLAGLLSEDVLGIRVGPVRVGLSDKPVMFAVCSRRTSKGTRQIARRGERACGLVDAAGQTGSDLLQQPFVTVRVTERGEGTVIGVIARGPANAVEHTVWLELSAPGAPA
jgi:hypothetical protein